MRNTLSDIPTKRRLLIKNRILSKVKDVDGCWEWQGKIYKGYSVYHISIKGKTYASSAHRILYMIIKGDIKFGNHLDHLCRNRTCVNPNHLEPVTVKENNLRAYGVNRLNASKTHCIRGHEFTTQNTLIRIDGARMCRECNRLRVKGYREV